MRWDDISLVSRENMAPAYENGIKGYLSAINGMLLF